MMPPTKEFVVEGVFNGPVEEERVESLFVGRFFNFEWNVHITRPSKTLESGDVIKLVVFKVVCKNVTESRTPLKWSIMTEIDLQLREDHLIQNVFFVEIDPSHDMVGYLHTSPTETWPVRFVLKLKVADIIRSFNQEEYADITLNVSGVQFFVSKWWLTSHSEMFKSMFASDFCESQQKEIGIPDTDPYFFHRLLEVLNGEVVITDANLAPILELVDYYDTATGRRACLEFMLNRSTRCTRHLFRIADQFGFQEVKDMCFSRLKTISDVVAFYPFDLDTLEDQFKTEDMAKLLKVCYELFHGGQRDDDGPNRRRRMENPCVYLPTWLHALQRINRDGPRDGRRFSPPYRQRSPSPRVYRGGQGRGASPYMNNFGGQRPGYQGGFEDRRGGQGPSNRPPSPRFRRRSPSPYVRRRSQGRTPTPERFRERRGPSPVRNQRAQSPRGYGRRSPSPMARNRFRSPGRAPMRLGFQGGGGRREASPAGFRGGPGRGPSPNRRRSPSPRNRYPSPRGGPGFAQNDRRSPSPMARNRSRSPGRAPMRGGFQGGRGGGRRGASPVGFRVRREDSEERRGASPARGQRRASPSSGFQRGGNNYAERGGGRGPGPSNRPSSPAGRSVREPSPNRRRSPNPQNRSPYQRPGSVQNDRRSPSPMARNRYQSPGRASMRGGFRGGRGAGRREASPVVFRGRRGDSEERRGASPARRQRGSSPPRDFGRGGSNSTGRGGGRGRGVFRGDRRGGPGPSNRPPSLASGVVRGPSPNRRRSASPRNRSPSPGGRPGSAQNGRRSPSRSVRSRSQSSGPPSRDFRRAGDNYTGRGAGRGRGRFQGKRRGGPGPSNRLPSPAGRPVRETSPNGRRSPRPGSAQNERRSPSPGRASTRGEFRGKRGGIGRGRGRGGFRGRRGGAGRGGSSQN